MICLSIKEYQKAIWFVALKHQDTFIRYFFILFVFCFFRQRFDLIFPPKLEEFHFHFIKILLARSLTVIEDRRIFVRKLVVEFWMLS